MGYLQKEGVRPNPDTPKTILYHNSTYKLHTKTAEFPKLRTFKVGAPTRNFDIIFVMLQGKCSLRFVHEKCHR